ncbi:MAG: hypothetical protein NT051_03145 [Candidatus Micrarchaeota archaeon]|nr:hypothetical protein [Candidatus Micrarchaeota archaeon]
MPADSALYTRLNDKWQTTCKILFGKEIGELARYKEWLLEGLEPFEKRKSSISGKEVVAVGEYPKGAPFISFDEIDYSRKFKPLSINEMKDIDSIIGAVKERAAFCGNTILGNSSYCEESTGLEDCNFMLGCHTFHTSQDMAYCTIGREVKASFGSLVIGESSFSIKGHNNWRTSRCLCDQRVYESNDIVYSDYLDGCTECLFCFGLQGKRRMVGNAQLGENDYAKVKEKLLSDIADELEAKGRAPTLIELVPNTPFKLSKPLSKKKALQFDESKVQAAFDETCSIVLGRKIGNVRDYKSYLTHRIRNIKSMKSAVSGEDIYVGGYRIDLALAKSGRAVKLEELREICGERKWPEGIEAGKLTLANAGKLIEPVAVFCTEEYLLSSNAAESSTVHYGNSILCCSRAYHAKDSAYSCWPRDCDHMFGCDATRNSSFCLNCYNSYKLSRCFEVDTSQNCTGCLFCHNCENVHDSMFCFNVKNLRYAIGNAEVGKEEFMRIKKLVLSEITASLEKKKDFPVGIYDIARAGKR